MALFDGKHEVIEVKQRNYMLIDFVVPAGLWQDWDRVVRFMEYVRQHFTQIVPGIPAACELDLIAGGHAHHPAQVPLLGLCAPDADFDLLPHPDHIIDTTSAWCAARSAGEIESIISQTDAPTWNSLVQDGAYPPIKKAE